MLTGPTFKDLDPLKHSDC